MQLCVQGLILREHGYQCDDGVLYFVASRERVRVVFDDELIATTERAVEGLRNVAQGGTIPPPLEDSPKCPRCSLVSICLPDEINHLALLSRPGAAPRPIAVPSTDALPLYVQARGAKVAKSGETLVVSVNDEKLGHGPPRRDLAGGAHGQHLHHRAVPAGIDVARGFRSLGTATAAGSTATR